MGKVFLRMVEGNSFEDWNYGLQMMVTGIDDSFLVFPRTLYHNRKGRQGNEHEELLEYSVAFLHRSHNT